MHDMSYKYKCWHINLTMTSICYCFSLDKCWSERAIAKVCCQIYLTDMTAMVIWRSVASMPFNSLSWHGGWTMATARSSHIARTMPRTARERWQATVSYLTWRTRHLRFPSGVNFHVNDSPCFVCPTKEEHISRCLSSSLSFTCTWSSHVTFVKSAKKQHIR